MDIIIKQRILGSLVLIAIAIVIVPALMSGNASVFHESLKSNIPEKPAFVIDLSEEQKLRVAAENEKMAARALQGELDKSLSESKQFPLTEAWADAESSTVLAIAAKPATDVVGDSTDNMDAEKSTRSPSAPDTQAENLAPANRLIASKPIATPDMPVVEIKTVDEKKAAIALAKPVQKPSAVNAPKSVTTQEKVTAKPAIAAAAVSGNSNQGWIVQVASFKKSANAQALQKRLARHGMQSSVVKNTSKNGMLYRVRLGPWETKDTAAEQQAALEKIVGMDTLLLKLH